MLEITCRPEIKQDVKKCLYENLESIGVSEQRRTGIITETPEGLMIDGFATMYCGTPEFDGDELAFAEDFMEEDERKPQEMLEKVKEQYPDIGINGTLQFGDDNYRMYFWFGSLPGEKDVVVDYAVDCDESHEGKGYPLSACAFVYEYYHDYGVEFIAIKNEEDVRKAKEILTQFKEYADRDETEEMYRVLWSRFTEQYKGPEPIYNLYNIGTVDIGTCISKKFLDYFFSHCDTPYSGTITASNEE